MSEQGTHAHTTHAHVAEANRRYYAKTAESYDATECCVIDPRKQLAIVEDLTRIIAITGRAPRELRALDACAGSGNMTRRLLATGMQVTAVDISPDLLAILNRHCEADRARLDVVCSEVLVFLKSPGPSYDLITFSSALHHLADVEGILSLAARRLAPGGLLYTAFDPTPREDMPRSAQALIYAEYLGFKLISQTSDVPRAALRKLKRIIGGRLRNADKQEAMVSDENLGVLAEYHVERGLDDRALAELLRSEALAILWHERAPHARFLAVERVLARMGVATDFKLLAQRGAY